MKTWNEYFELNEEHHAHSRREKINYICETVSALPNVLVDRVYTFIEDMMEEDEQEHRSVEESVETEEEIKVEAEVETEEETEE